MRRQTGGPTSLPFKLGPEIEERPVVVPPLPALLKSVRLLGHNFLPFDIDGPARRMPPFIRQGDHYMPSLGLAAALVAGGFKAQDVVLEKDAVRFGERRMPLAFSTVYDSAGEPRPKKQLTMLVNDPGPAVRPNGERPFKTYEMRHVIESELQSLNGVKPGIDPRYSRTRSCSSVSPPRASWTSFKLRSAPPAGAMPGVQMHASVADSILSNRFIRPAADRWRVLAVAAAALLVGLLAAFLPFNGAAPAALPAMVGWRGLRGRVQGRSVDQHDRTARGDGAGAFCGTAYQYFVEGREKRKVKMLFGRYVSKDVYDQLLAHPERAELGGKRRDMSVLFSDIRGFTAVTEKGSPRSSSRS